MTVIRNSHACFSVVFLSHINTCFCYMVLKGYNVFKVISFIFLSFEL